MRATNKTAIAPIIRLKGPRFHGPGRKRLSRTKKTRIAMGMLKATNWAIPPMENRAPIAVSPAKTRKTIRIPRTMFKITALIGVLDHGFIFLQMEENGKHPSRA